MILDLVLAIGHHILVFALAGLISAELVLLRPVLTRDGIARLARIDRAYGGIAGAVILVGVGRVFFGLKGWEFYAYNPAFWAKMAAFAAVGLLSIAPTRTILQWNKAGEGRTVAPAEIAAVRRNVSLQAGIFVLIPVFAAAMARGFGM